MENVLITGVTGQDGAYLARALLGKGYRVYGAVRRGSTPKVGRLKSLGIIDKVRLVGVETTEFSNILSVMRELRPKFIYNLAAQSFVADSFSHPHLTTDVNYVGYLNILEAVRLEGLSTRIYQASTSEMYGDVLSDPQSEETAFNPMSPYAVSKAAAHFLGVNYRKAYGMNISNGILFNHESELRGREFVTRKISTAVSALRAGSSAPVLLGNLDSVRDWGYAPEYVEGMIMINEANCSADYVIATNTITTVRDFFKFSAIAAGFQPEFSGEGVSEVCVCRRSGKKLCQVDRRLFRPSDVVYLRGDFQKINKQLGWKPSVFAENIAEKMVSFDIKLLEDRFPPGV